MPSQTVVEGVMVAVVTSGAPTRIPAEPVVVQPLLVVTVTVYVVEDVTLVAIGLAMVVDVRNVAGVHPYVYVVGTKRHASAVPAVQFTKLRDAGLTALAPVPSSIPNDLLAVVVDCPVTLPT